MKIFIVAIAILICGAVITSAQPRLGGVRWELAEINGKTVAGSRAFIEFNESEKRFTGNASCNRMFGSYELSGSEFKTSGTGTTRMACMKPGLMETERDFLKALADATRLKKRGSILSLYAGDRMIAKLRMAQHSETKPAVDLTSMKWMLSSIGGTKVNLSKDAPFLNFDAEKKSAGGNSGCNVFGGSYGSTGTSIKFGQMISTMRACEFEDRMTIERGFLDGLQNADRYEIKDGKLFIYQSDSLLLEFSGANK